MQEGAFILIDCLGFKGIWGRYKAQDVINKLCKIEDLLENEISLSSTEFETIKQGLIKPQIKLLSDTVAISVKLDEDYLESIKANAPEELYTCSAYLVGIACLILLKVLDFFARDEPHLLMRGCVTYGKHLAEKNFIIGPAVDEAAELMNLPNGAFVWITPSAQEKYEHYEKSLMVNMQLALENNWLQSVEDEIERWALEQSFLIAAKMNSSPMVIPNYEMPLKNGEKLKCSVINPLSKIEKEEERQKFINVYLSEMSVNKLDIVIKRQNTEKFLNFASSQTKEFFEDLAKHLPK